MSFEKSVYRLIGMDGRPHPILDTQYESMDAAINAVNNNTNHGKYCFK